MKQAMKHGTQSARGRTSSCDTCPRRLSAHSCSRNALSVHEQGSVQDRLRFSRHILTMSIAAGASGTSDTMLCKQCYQAHMGCLTSTGLSHGKVACVLVSAHCQEALTKDHLDCGLVGHVQSVDPERPRVLLAQALQPRSRRIPRGGYHLVALCQELTHKLRASMPLTYSSAFN